MSAADTRRIAVIGAGIGGLTLAVALRPYGISVDIYEQTTELREVGAAVALSANATRFFEQFGLATQFASRWFEVSALIRDACAPMRCRRSTTTPSSASRPAT